MKRLFGTVLLTTLLMVAVEGQAVVLSLEPASSTVSPGDSVTLDLTVSGLGNGSTPSLGAFDVDIGYDSAKLNFTGYILGTFLGDVVLFEALDASSGDSTPPGVIDLAETSLLSNAQLDGLQPDSFVLASLDFIVTAGLAPGQSTTVEIINNQNLILSDGAGDALTVDALNSATLTRQAAPPPPSGVPEPATLALLVVGIGGMKRLHGRRGIGA